MGLTASVVPLYINGKFTAQRTTGVQRYAAGLVVSLDRLLAAQPVPQAPCCTLLLPPGAQPPVLRRIALRELAVPPWAPARLRLHVWEQVVLPRAARGGLLVNLSGSAPWLVAAQVATLHDAAVWDHPQAYTWAFRAWYRALFRHLVRRPGRRLVPSAFSANRLAAALAVPSTRFDLVPGGSDALLPVEADAGTLRRHGLQPQRYLLAVGSANPTKNLVRLQRAWAALPAARRGGCVLVLAGGGAPAVFRAESQTPRADAVRHLGAVSDAELKALMQQALALVCPSVYEGFGLPPLEAMACGCPVAAARAAALPAVLGEAALFFDPVSDADIGQALARLIADASLRERLSAQGRDWAARHTWDHAAAQLWPLLQNAAAGQAGSGG